MIVPESHLLAFLLGKVNCSSIRYNGRSYMCNDKIKTVLVQS